MAPLPNGVTQNEVDELYNKLKAEAQAASINFCIDTTPHPFNRMMAVTLGVYPPPMPAFNPGASQDEWNEIYNRQMQHTTAYQSRYITNRWPYFLLPNLADQIANNPPTPPGTAPSIAWKAKVNNSGGTVSDARFAAIDSLIANLSAAGVFQNLDRLWIFAGENQTQALIDLVAAAQASPVNSPTFTPNKGFQGDGVSSYINSNFAPSAGKGTQNAAGFGCWIDAANTVGQAPDCGYEGTGGVPPYARLDTRYTAGFTFSAVNDSTSGGSKATSTSVGFFHVQRASSAQSDLYVNGAPTTSNVTVSGAMQTGNLVAFRAGTTGSVYSNARASALWCGANMTAAQVASFYQALTAFFQAINPVTNAETTAWMNSVANAGSSVSAARQARIDTLITNLKAAGVWTGLDRLWVFAAENSQQGLTDLIGANVATAVNSPSFTPDKGFQGNGTSAYINTGFNWQVGTNKFALNNCDMGVWVDLVGQTGSANSCLIGHENGAYSQLYTSGTGRIAALLTNAGNMTAWTPASMTGFYHVQRTGSAAQAAYGQGGVVEQTGTQTSSTLGNRNVFVLANNYPGPTTPISFALSRLSMAWIGQSFTQTQITAFYNALNTYFGQIASDDPTVFDFMPGTGTMPAGATLARASTGWRFDTTLTLASAASNVARFNYDPASAAANPVLQGLLDEPASTQGINNNNTGVTSGVIGSGGVLPTGWSANATPGATVTIVGTGTANGMPYMDVRWQSAAIGTPGGENHYMAAVSGAGSIAAGVNDVWTVAMFIQLVGGSFTNVQGMRLGATCRNAAGSGVGNLFGSNFTPVAGLQRYTTTQTIVAGDTVNIQPVFAFSYTNGAAVDFTLRLMAPCANKGAVPCSPIIAGTTAVTRATDILNVPLNAGVYSFEANRTGQGQFSWVDAVNANSFVVPQSNYPLRTLAATLMAGLTGFNTRTALPSGAALTRASTAWYFDSTLALVSAANDVARFAYDPLTGNPLGLLVEPTVTNTVRNSSAGGAVPGTPGTVPTNWSLSGSVNGLTQTIVGSGTEDGIPYVDVRWNGTITTASSHSIFAEGFAGSPTANLGQTWTSSWYVRLVAGSLANITSASIQHYLTERDSGGTTLGSTIQNMVPTGAPLKTQRFDSTRVFNQAATAKVVVSLGFSYPLSAVIDLTLRLGLPQLVLAATPTSPIVTTNAAVTRAQDICTLPFPAGVWQMQMYAPTPYILNNIPANTGGWQVLPDARPFAAVIGTPIVGLTGLNFMQTVIPTEVTFNRASTAQGINASGFLASYAVDAPRMSTDPVTLLPRGLHAEPASSNFIPQSNAFSTAPWTLSRCTATAAQAISPDGTNNGWLIKEDTTATNNHGIGASYGVTGIIGHYYIQSVYAKAKERTWLYNFISSGMHAGAAATYFDLVNGVVGGNVSCAAAGMINAGNGWWRCWIAVLCDTAGAVAGNFYLASANNGGNYTGDGASGLYLWGGQIEDIGVGPPTLGPTSYIPTTTVAVPRAADIAKVTIPPGVYDIQYVRVAGTTTSRVTTDPSGVLQMPPDRSHLQYTLRTFVSSLPNLLNPETSAYWTAVVQNGGTMTSDRALLIDQFISSLKAAGCWALTDDMWMLCAENAQQALMSMKQLRLCNAVNSPIFTVDRGYAFNGTTNYIDTAFFPVGNAVALTTTNMRIGIYERTNLASGNWAGGSFNFSTSAMLINPRNGTNQLSGNLNANGCSAVPTINDSRGLSVHSRSGNSFAFYKNGADMGLIGPGTVQNTPSTNSLYIGGANNAPTAFNFGRAVSNGFFTVGASMSPQQETAFYNALQTFMTAIGAQV